MFLSAFPSRKKLKSTSKYIYQTLFLNGENSDIKICALGEEWNLHKIYLCQSGYFSSMFSGSWRESSMDVIELEIPDQNIDVEALQVAFGSLYRDDVLIKPSRVVALLAAACMLQLVSNKRAVFVCSPVRQTARNTHTHSVSAR
uniref:BTB domain-containing protein n=1 Tax=Anas zonorhyncha TaxID=75864 RepID=A0A8B9V3I2_9AVES